MIEVTQIHKGNKSKVDITKTNRQFTAPTETGLYYYNVHAKWEEEIKGEAYYAFKVAVRN
ncbi:hypothetical protein [Ornithinibacillus halophilus]|uniref:YtkA-like n=1 Tax=Ornithinibacillus halophilus TaxID=930117 RepID=A0A1M5IQA5_9BACI|nr:hypothetical protein [Ornithinibacillus halophilus]SHG29973.1 hypothetical protein SAMN05216225_102518 [Ornithinibacillus halophilus]